jgi:hypothetical protein
MDKLQFKLDRGFMVQPVQPMIIDIELMKANEDYWNKFYEPFIEKINACGGYIQVTISNDGTSITNNHLMHITAKLIDEIEEHKRSKSPFR